jgi:hypothetical protein
MTLQPIPSEFPYIRGKIYFLFFQCIVKEGISESSNELTATLQGPTEGRKVGSGSKLPSTSRRRYKWRPLVVHYNPNTHLSSLWGL